MASYYPRANSSIRTDVARQPMHDDERVLLQGASQSPPLCPLADVNDLGADFTARARHVVQHHPEWFRASCEAFGEVSFGVPRFVTLFPFFSSAVCRQSL